jgi:hypothetical protein
MRFLILAAVLLAACTERAPDPGRPTKVDRSYVLDNLLDAPPASMGRRVDARFTTRGGGEVVYLGNDAPATAVAPGDKVTITHYWQVVTPPGPGWRVFAHLLGGSGEFVNADATDLRTGHPVAAWKAGQVLRDEQTVVVPRDWSSRSARLVVGLFQPGKHRIADRAEVDGFAERAVPVAELQIDLSRAPPPPGTLIVKKAAGEIVVDGKADEPGWRTAAVQTAFTSAEGCPELVDSTEAKLTWDDRFLYVFVASEDADVFSPFTNHDDHLWENDVVEVFLDADGNRRGYIELQVNPRNATFDTWFVQGRPNRDDSFDAGLQTQVIVKGTVDNRDDGDSGWDVELAIPHEAARGKDPAMKIRVPPQPGDTWRLNVVRVDKDRSGKVRAASWNRIGCEDFHALDRMLTVQFADEAGNTKVVTPPPAAPAEPVPGVLRSP